MSMRMVSLREAVDILETGAPLIDVRTPVEFRTVRAESAQCFPLDGLEGSLKELSTLAAGKSHMLLICKSGKRAAKAAEKLQSAFENTEMAVIEGGMDAWVDAGLNVVRDKAGISIERQVRIIAGLLGAVGSVLALTASVWFALLPLVVGLGLLNAGLTDWCGMGLFLAKMPWNK